MPRYNDEYKIKAIQQLEQGRSVPEVAAALGTSTEVLYDWVRRAARGRFKDFKLSGKFVVKTQKKFSDEEKRGAVKRIEAGEETSRVADDLGTDPGVVRKWRIKFRGESAFDPELGAADAEAGLKKLRAMDAKRERERKQQLKAERDQAKRIQEMVADPLVWMQKYTETKDSHWREHGALSPYRPFPDLPYFRPLVEVFQKEPIFFIEKSRNMMLSWLCVGLFTHAAMTTPGIEVLFQSQKEEKAFELVDYAKILYDRQRPELKEAFPLVKKLTSMADGELVFAHGSRIIGIPGGADQIRSYHPWGLFMDEAAFMPEAEGCYNNAVPVCKKMIILSSAGPGWFADVMTDCV